VFRSDQDFGFDEWLWNLPNILAEAALVDEAVADALARLDIANASQYAGDAATISARAGRPAEARARVEANLGRWPESPWVRIQVGEALVAADDLEAARLHFHQAVEIAKRRGDPSEVDTAYEYLIGFLAGPPGGRNDGDAARRDRAAWQRRTGWISRRRYPLR
jgi:tetratricopeptide (TPR) repeat protein